MANVAQLTTAEYTARFNDQMSAGASAAAEAMEKFAEAVDGTDAKTRRSSSSLAALEARLDSNARLAQASARANETLTRQTEQLSAAVARGAITQERANQLAEMATQKRDVYLAGVRRQIAAEEERNRILLGGVTAQDRLGAANDNVAQSSGRFGQAMGQAGFQVQDFATQVSMGQNALVAFGVQFAQFAGIFGTAGAIAGAVVTVGVLAAQLLQAEDASKKLKEAQELLARAAREAGQLLDAEAEAAERQERAARASTIQTLAQAAALLRAEQATRALRQAELASSVDQVRLAREVGGPDTQIPDNIRRRVAEYDRLTGELQDVANRIQQIEDQMGRAQSGATGAQRDSVERTLEGLRREVDREQERADQQEARARDRARAAAERDAAAEQREADRREREEQRAREQAERETQRRNDTVAREEQRVLREREREAERTTDSIVSYAADRFADLWSNTGRGFAGLMQSMLQMVRQTFARIAAEAIIRPIVQPIVQGIMGTGGAGGGAGGLGDLFGIGSSINSLTGGGIGNALGLSGGLGGIASSINTWGASTGIFGNGITAAMQGPTLSGAPLGSLAQSGWFSGSSTLTSSLGGIGGGFMIGSTIGGLIAGDRASRQRNSQIGAGIGAVGGAFFGPVGSLIGGALGGAIGGMIGPANSNKAGDADFDFATGQFTIGGQTGKKFSQANRDAALGLGTRLRDSLTGVAAAIGGDLPSTGTFRVGVGSRDGLFLRLPGQEGQRFARSEAGAQELIGTALRGLIPSITGGMSDQFRAAIAAANATTGEQITEIATWIGTVFRPLTEIKEPVDAFAEAMKALNKTYDDAVARAKELGLSEQALQDGRARAIADLEKARREQAAPAAAGAIGNLADFISGLRFSDVSPLSPRAQFSAANDNFSALLARAQGGDFGALSGLRGAAETLLAQGRNVEGSGAGFTALFDRVSAALGGIGALSADELTASVYRETQKEATDILAAQLERLTAEVSALRQETRLNGLTPARAA
jgi:hypothetical protein